MYNVHVNNVIDVLFVGKIVLSVIKCITWHLLHKYTLYMYLKTRLEFDNVYLQAVWWFWVSVEGGSRGCYSLKERTGTGHCPWTGYCQVFDIPQVCPTSHSPSYSDPKDRYINSMCNKHLSWHLSSFGLKIHLKDFSFINLIHSSMQLFSTLN